MADKDSTTGWDKIDKRWREVTYLDYLADKSADEQEQALRQILCWSCEGTTFAPDQPKPFAEFAGCRADLKLHKLLDDDRQFRLQRAIAGGGARVPGTKFVLRVARPWYAYFDEREGDFPTLPHNWMEMLHAHKDDFGDKYEWIGRQHSWLEYIVHWERYEELPSGFRLITRPLPKLTEKRLRTEIEQVLAEIREFKEHLLPGIAASDPDLFTAQLNPDPKPWTERLRTLDEWQNAAGQLRQILESQLSQAPRTLDITAFERFMWSKPSVDYTIEEHRIHWQISCYAKVDWLSAVHTYFRQDFGWPPKDENHPGYSVEATKHWLLAGSVQSTQLWNALTAGVLPAVADHDPAFAKRLLSWEDWWLRIATNPTLSESERDAELDGVCNKLPFKLVLHNALLHVIGSLANNHFMEIRPLLAQPEFVGRYGPLIPHYLLANLFGKVRVLTDLWSASLDGTGESARSNAEDKYAR